jgi:hypothetical protein
MFAPLTKPKSAEPQRFAVAARRPGRAAIAQFQQSIGNQAMLRLLAQRAGATSNTPAPIQAKLNIGAVNDPLEHEADRVADQVMRMSATAVSAAAAPPQVSRKCADCEEEDKLQRKSAGPQTAAGKAAAIVHEVLGSPGQSLDAATRGFFEPRFGRDFSAVRVHTGPLADQSARHINAHAYTAGHNMVFGAGQFAPGTQEGRRLLAHELTHVVQQSASAASPSAKPTVQRQPAAPAAAAPAAPAAPDPAAPAAPAADPNAANGGLTEEMLKQIARTLHEAMEGWGTDEEAIYSAFSGRTQKQVDAIERVYNHLYSADLVADLRDELSESEMQHLAIFSPTAAPGKPDSVQQATALADESAYQLNKAMDRWGTDEDAIFSVLTGRTPTELKAIKDAYKNLTKRDLEADLRDEMSGSELTRALALFGQGVLLPEDEAYLAMKGAGTDEETLLRVLETVKGDRAKVTDLIDKFYAKGYGNLLEWVNEELSGSDLDKAMEALQGQTPTGACSAPQRAQALEAISLAVAMAQNAVTRADMDLASNQLSGSLKDALDQYFNPGNAPNAVDLGLLRKVRDALDRTRTDILSLSNVVCVTQNDGSCVIDPDCDSFVSAWTTAPAGAQVNLCPAFFSCDKNRPRSILHEFCHHLGIHDLKIYYGEPGYSSLTPLGDGSVKDSLSKADAYAHFAKELF